MKSQIVIAALLSALSVPAFAGHAGASVSTKDGRNIAITSNEVARLGSLLQKEHGG